MAGPDHLDENAIAQLLDGLLPDEARRNVEAHVDACDACQALLAAVARAGGQDSELTSRTGEPDASAPLSRESLRGGARFGRYIILDRLGVGGMGVVYGAYDPRLDRRVALKLLHPESERAATAEGRASLLREARSMARLSHPNVVAVYDAGEIGGEVYLAMEFVEGKTLRQWVSERPRSWREVLVMYLQVGEGLAAAHRAGLLHHDFKPDNVLVDATGRARVADFGLAGRVPPGRVAECARPGESASPGRAMATAARASAITGTPAYMAPEQLAGGAADQRSDQFAFCVALYESLYGERPFDTEAAPGLPVKRAPRPLPKDAKVPPWLRRVLARGLAEAPDERHASLDELLSTLRAPLLASEPLSGVPGDREGIEEGGPGESSSPLDLGEFWLLRDLPAGAIAALRETARERWVAAGEQVFAAGDGGRELFLLRRGRVRVLAPGEGGGVRVLNTLGPGDYFGDLAYLDGAVRSADVVAASDADLFVLTPEDVGRAALRFPGVEARIVARIAVALARRLRSVTTPGVPGSARERVQ
jgi:serine/threonine protein kinase